MPTILLLASIQAFFLVFLLVSKRNKHLSDRVLAIWLGLIGLHTLISFAFLKFQFQNPYILNLNAGFPFLQGPFLYFYVDTLTSRPARLKRSYAWHFVPFLIFVAYQMFLLNPFWGSSTNKQVVVHLFSLPGIFNALLLTSVPVYILISLLLLHRYKAWILSTFSTIEKINLNWLRYLIAALGVVWVVVIISFLQTKITGQSHLIFIAITLFVYLTGYFGFKQTTVFSDVGFHKAPEHTEDVQPVISPIGKYQKSGLREDQARATLDRLLAYMAEEKPYLDDQLTLSKLAGDLDISDNHLSQIINEHRQQNFFDFVNTYRVDSVKQKLQQPEFEAYSLLAIALDCGFGSKSSFNRIFKNLTGQTPTQYRKAFHKD